MTREGRAASRERVVKMGKRRLEAAAVANIEGRAVKKRQMLPTPQASTASTASWSKEDFEYSSEIEVIDVSLSSPVGSINSGSGINFNAQFAKRPRMLRSTRHTTKSNSSWPFRSNSINSCPEQLVPFDSSPLQLRFKRVKASSFPYARAITKLTPTARSLIFDPKLWALLLRLSTIYAGECGQGGDTQKRNEIAFAAWTTLLRVYGVCAVRGGAEEMKKLAVAAVVLQSKLLEEADVDLVKLAKKLTWVSAAKIEESERKISKLLRWKLLTPSPQVILFAALDAMSVQLSAALKLLASRVLDKLIEEFFLHELLSSSPEVFDLVNVVGCVIEIVLEDFFSVFPLPQGEKFAADFKMEKRLPEKYRERIERAIEVVVSKG